MASWSIVRDAGTESADPRSTYVQLEVATAPADAVDAPPVGVPAPAPVEQPEKPLVDPAVCKSHEQWQHMQQSIRWDEAWRLMSGRQRACALEFIFTQQCGAAPRSC
jgi:hypothetical protein